MADLLILTTSLGGSNEVLPALALLPHRVRVLPMEPAALVEAPGVDVVMLDARRDLAQARSTSRLLRATGMTTPLILVLTEGALTVVTADWGASDLVLATATPAEVEARLRLAVERAAQRTAADAPEEISAGDLSIDASGYTARLRGRPVDLTYKEFELIKYLVQHPGRVFTRAQLLQEVWGYDYFGGTRTVDVHVRRLRAKLGPEHEQLIGTVRNVGYRFDLPKDRTGASVTTGRPSPATASEPEADEPRAPAASPSAVTPANGPTGTHDTKTVGSRGDA